MTAITPGQPAAPPGPPLEAIEFPLGWLLDHAAAPIQYRATTEVARPSVALPPGFHALPYTFEPALALALTQALDGSWGGAMLTVPGGASSFRGVGTITAVRRLLEYGWDRDSPPLLRARRLLFRLLAEDEDPAFAFELAPGATSHGAVVRRARGILREAAAAALAQAGYEKDPRLRGAASRIIERLGTFLRSPMAQEPFVRAGNHRVLAPDAAPPSFYTLVMLAHMPLFRSENYETTERVRQYLVAPAPRSAPAQLVEREILPAPHLVLGDPLPSHAAADADIPWALTWLELAARLGFLRRGEGWTATYERLLEERDSAGVWHPRRGTAAPHTDNPLAWPGFPLEPRMSGEARWTDVTFRLGLIGRLAGRPVHVV